MPRTFRLQDGLGAVHSAARLPLVGMPFLLAALPAAHSDGEVAPSW